MTGVALDIGASYSKLIVLKEGHEMTTHLIKTNNFENTTCVLLRMAKKKLNLKKL